MASQLNLPEARYDALVGDHADGVLRAVGVAPVDLLLQAILPLPQLLQIPRHGRVQLLGDHLRWSGNGTSGVISVLSDHLSLS